MKRVGAVLAILMASCMMLALSVPASAGFLQDGTGLVSMEAEHYQANVPNIGYSWSPVTIPGYSGSGALPVMPDDGRSPLNAGGGPRLDYQVRFTRAGTHYVWIRALSHSSASDSLYVGLDGATTGALYMTGMNLDGQTWTWTRQRSGGVATINVTSIGLHTINVWMRESGIVLDKLVLTTRSSYAPTGQGPPETPENAAGLPPAVTTNAATSVTSSGATVNGGVGPHVTAFSDGSVNPRATYSYRVHAWNVSGDSPPSNVVEVTTPQADTELPAE